MPCSDDIVSNWNTADDIDDGRRERALAASIDFGAAMTSTTTTTTTTTTTNDATHQLMAMPLSQLNMTSISSV